LRAFFGIQIKYSVRDRQASSKDHPDGVTMGFNEELAERIRRGLTRRKGIEAKKMFGGIVFFLNGNLLVGVWKNSLIVRLGQDQ
jgi:hypothetical protein